jgi:hypothetical protein
MIGRLLAAALAVFALSPSAFAQSTSVGMNVTGSIPTTNNCAKFSGPNSVADAGSACGGGSVSPITSSSAQCFAVGPNGNTNPSLNVDCSTASAATGLNIKSFAAGGGVGAGLALSVTSTASDEIMRLDAKGAAILYLQHTGTGAIEADHSFIINYASASTNVCTDGSKVVQSSCSGVNGSYGGMDVINNGGAYKVGGTIVMRPGGISVASGFCTSPSVTNGQTAAFAVTIGTACTGVKSGVITMQAATTKWSCQAEDATNTDSFILAAFSTSTTSVTIKNYSRTTGAAADFTASDVIQVMCLGY